MEDNTNKKNIMHLGLLIIGIFVLYSIIGMVARQSFLDSEKPYPTWSHDSDISALNTWTAWDSGFYYDLAENGYPQITDDIPAASINIPEGTWAKLFLGGAVIGDKRFPLNA